MFKFNFLNMSLLCSFLTEVGSLLWLSPISDWSSFEYVFNMQFVSACFKLSLNLAVNWCLLIYSVDSCFANEQSSLIVICFRLRWFIVLKDFIELLSEFLELKLWWMPCFSSLSLMFISSPKSKDSLIILARLLVSCSSGFYTLSRDRFLWIYLLLFFRN